jgi:uncharacterized protein (TIGR02246 family)
MQSETAKAKQDDQQLNQQTNPQPDDRQQDKEQIRQLVHTWLDASKRGDLPTLLKLLADDVLFITPGKEPFGKEAFATANKQQMQDTQMEAAIDIKEIEGVDDWAWMRSFLRVSFTQAGKDPLRLSGHILTILQKNPEGQWVIKRDANFVAPEKNG